MGLALLAVVGLVAYRQLWTAAFLELRAISFEAWLFFPDLVVHLPALGVAGWLLWRRREAFLRSGGAPSRTLAWVLAGLAIAFLALGQRAGGSLALLLVSACFVLLAFAAGNRGAAGVRVLLAPALVLLLGIRLPAPLESEVIWALQRLTARGAALLSNLLGQEVTSAGVMLWLWSDRVSFQVIESCSGFQTGRMLLFVAIVLREVLGPTRRLLVLLAFAPLVGILVNILRALIIVYTDPRSAAADWVGNHAVQGVAALIAGVGPLCGLGLLLARTQRQGERLAEQPGAKTREPVSGLGDRGAGPSSESPPDPEHERRPRNGDLPWRIALPLCVPVLLASVVPAAPSEDRQLQGPIAPTHPQWTSERVAPTGPASFFFGGLPREAVVHRVYERAGEPQLVELFIVLDQPDEAETDRFFTSRLVMPGPGWELQQCRPVDLSLSGAAKAEESVVEQGGSSASVLAYTWRIRDRGVWRESWRDVRSESPARDGGPRVAVRIATPLRGKGPFAEAQARRVLDRFLIDFRNDLANL